MNLTTNPVLTSTPLREQELLPLIRAALPEVREVRAEGAKVSAEIFAFSLSIGLGHKGLDLKLTNPVHEVLLRYAEVAATQQVLDVALRQVRATLDEAWPGWAEKLRLRETNPRAIFQLAEGELQQIHNTSMLRWRWREDRLRYEADVMRGVRLYLFKDANTVACYGDAMWEVKRAEFDTNEKRWVGDCLHLGMGSAVELVQALMEDDSILEQDELDHLDAVRWGRLAESLSGFEWARGWCCLPDSRGRTWVRNWSRIDPGFGFTQVHGQLSRERRSSAEAVIDPDHPGNAGFLLELLDAGPGVDDIHHSDDGWELVVANILWNMGPRQPTLGRAVIAVAEACGGFDASRNEVYARVTGAAINRTAPWEVEHLDAPEVAADAQDRS